MSQVSGTSLTPSAGASSGAANSGGANSSAVDYSATSDDQILDLDTTDAGDGDLGLEDGGDGGAGDQDQGDDELNLDGDETGDEDEGQGQDEEELGDESEEGDQEEGEEQELQDQTPAARTVPPQFRELFKKHPELRTAYFAERAYREVIPTVNEAREYKQLAPTVEDLRVAVDNSTQLQELDGLFYSTDPQAKAQLLTRMHTEDPEAFKVLAQEFGRAVHQLDPETYNSQVAEPIVVATLQGMMQRAISEGIDGTGKNLAAAVEVISRRLFGVPLAQLQGRNQGRQQGPDPGRQQLNSERQQFNNERYEAFHESTNQTVVSSVNKLIESTLAGLVKGTALATRPKALERIKAEAFQKLDASLRANRGLTELLRKELTNVRRSGKYTPEAARTIVGLMTGRAKGIVPKAVAQVVSEYTKDILGESSRRVQNAQRAANRTEAGSGRGQAGKRGAAGGAQTGRPTAKDIDYGRTSDDDILSGKAYRRK